MQRKQWLPTITIALSLMSTLLTLNLVGGVAHAQTDIYVDAATGDNRAGDGSAEKPYKTITFALARSVQLGTPEPWHIHVRPGTYNADPAKPSIDREVFPLKLRNGMLLEGTTAAAECIIDAKHITSSTFPILEGIGLSGITIRNLTLQNMNRTSDDGGAIHLNNTTGTLEGCVIRDNRASRGGGVWTNQSITIINNNFSGNSGGGFFVDGNFTGDVSGHTFSGNSTNYLFSPNSGGFSVSGNFTGDVLANTFSGNITGSGGGFFVNGNFTGDVSANTFSGNSGGWNNNGGGGFSVGGNFTGDVSGNTFSGNSVGWSSGGGGFSVRTLNGNISSNIFSRNYVDNREGGGFFIDTLNGNVSSNIFSRNTADKDTGGGFYLNRGTAKVFNNLFLYDSAKRNGNAVYTSAVTTFENNLFLDSGVSKVETVWLSSNQCRFHNNIFSGMQTAIFETGQFDLPITHNIFHNIGTDIVNRGGSGVGNDVLFWELLADRASDNLALAPMFVGEGIAQGAWTGIYDSARNETTLTNANASWNPNVFVGALVSGFLILRNTETTLLVQGNIVAAGVKDYQIDDYRLQATSPAIDAGTNEHAPLEDILGAPRPLKDGVVDIGPYEFGGQLPIAAKITLSANPTSLPADGKSQATLTATVTDESGKPHTRERC